MSTDETKDCCVFCGRDCSFLGFVEGCCLECGDKLYADHVHCIKTIVAGAKQVNRLLAERKQLDELARKAAAFDWLSANGAQVILCRETSDWHARNRNRETLATGHTPLEAVEAAMKGPA